MLGLPSTTEVERKLPKEAFYRNMKVSSEVRNLFVHQIDSITVMNTVKASTSNMADGDRVHEILVMRILLKQREISPKVLELIDRANPAKKVFICLYGNDGCIAINAGGVVLSNWYDSHSLFFINLDSARSLDELWDVLASESVFRDSGHDGMTVEERIELDRKIASLKEKISKTEAKMRREKQFARKNELFAEVKTLEKELEILEKGL